MKVVSHRIEEGEIKVAADLLELENAVLVFVNEVNHTKLGTLVAAIPQHGQKSCISSALLGGRNILITKILAEQLVNRFNKMALISIHLSEVKDRKYSSLLIRLIHKLGEKVK